MTKAKYFSPVLHVFCVQYLGYMTQLRWYENMQGSSTHLAFIIWCLWFIQTIKQKIPPSWPIFAAALNVCFFNHKSYTVTHWCVNIKRSKLHRNKIFLLTCWNLTKERSRDDYNWNGIPQNWPFYTTSATLQKMTFFSATLKWIEIE